MHPSGPKKVVDNLILGLEQFNIPYSINLDPAVCPYNIIHDDMDALMYLNQIQAHTKNLLGPNICFEPNNLIAHGVPLRSHILEQSKWLVPSQWVEKFWKQKGYVHPIAVWAVGVDTDTFTPENTLGEPVPTRQGVLLYTKGRSQEDIDEIKTFLGAHNIETTVFAYGTYSEAALMQAAKNARYGIILDSSESQGLAIEEMLALDLPLVVFDITTLDQKTHGSPKEYVATSVPYFDHSCGYSSSHIEEFKQLVLRIDRETNTPTGKHLQFQPRQFILNTLSLKKQAQELCNLFDTDLAQISAPADSLSPVPGKWKNRTWLYPFLRAKYIIKFIRWRWNAFFA